MMYILALFILSLIISYGYNAISHFRERGNEVLYVKFESEIKQLIKRTAHDYDSTIKEVLDVPLGYEYLCFIKSCNMQSGDCLVDNGLLLGSNEDKPFLLVYDSWSSNAAQNVFLVKKSGTIDSFETDLFRLSENDADVNYLCLDINRGRVNVEFYGQGDAALIRRWT